VIVPSVCHEFNPNVIREAFAVGVPVIASNRRGPREVIEDGASGLLFQAGDPEDLRRQMLRIVEEESLLERLRRNLPRVKTIEEDAQEMLHTYAALAS
jgi:glycosyltransferase involved in cell wall biosynthesis